MPSKISVVIFDDNKNIRDAIATLIASNDLMRLAGSFADARDLKQQLETAKPDVVLMDIDMPYINGIEAVKEIRASFPHIPVMMLTVFDDEDRVFNSIRAGAVGYMLKNTNPVKLLDAICEVHLGGAPMTPSIARKVMELFQHQKTPITTSENYNLSEREKDVLRLLVDGKAYKMISDQLGISYETVRTHMKHIYEKLHVASMTEAVAKAIQQKILH